MLKLSNKISKLSAYLVLLGYLTIATANVFHYHNIDLGKSYSFLSDSESKQNDHSMFIGSEILCPVQAAYNALYNSLVVFEIASGDFQNKPDVINLDVLFAKPLKTSILHYSLRAPPQIY